jgi:Holliday junction resolvase RusA-like endonuclease
MTTERRMFAGPITFSVLGAPATKGSTVSFVGEHGVVTKADCQTLAAWTQAVGWSAKAAGIRCAPRWAPVEVAAVVQFVRPMSAPKTRRLPTVKPDLDKIGRALLDALSNGIAYVDDAQVVTFTIAKQYGDENKTVVTVKPVQEV